MVNNGQEAIELTKTGEFAAILMDCQMPVVNGYDATKEIRKQAIDKKVPIIAMTAHGLEDERSRCIESGMDDYLAKPFRLDELELILSKHVCAQL